MDVNSSDWSQAEFIILSGVCSKKETWKCSKTGYACKDYMCPKVLKAKNIQEVRQNFLKDD